MRRKGGKPVVHPPLIWSETCTIARAIRTGDGWFKAWSFQQLPAKRLRGIGISAARFEEFWRGALPTDDELAALAEPLRTDVASLQASIDYERGLRRPRITAGEVPY